MTRDRSSLGAQNEICFIVFESVDWYYLFFCFLFYIVAFIDTQTHSVLMKWRCVRYLDHVVAATKKTQAFIYFQIQQEYMVFFYSYMNFLKETFQLVATLKCKGNRYYDKLTLQLKKFSPSILILNSSFRSLIQYKCRNGSFCKDQIMLVL